MNQQNRPRNFLIIDNAMMPVNTLAMKEAEISSKVMIRPLKAGILPSSIPAYNVGMTIIKGWAINLT